MYVGRDVGGTNGERKNRKRRTGYLEEMIGYPRRAVQPQRHPDIVRSPKVRTCLYAMTYMPLPRHLPSLEHLCPNRFAVSDLSHRRLKSGTADLREG